MVLSECPLASAYELLFSCSRPCLVEAPCHAKALFKVVLQPLTEVNVTSWPCPLQYRIIELCFYVACVMWDVFMCYVRIFSLCYVHIFRSCYVSFFSLCYVRFFRLGYVRFLGAGSPLRGSPLASLAMLASLACLLHWLPLGEVVALCAQSRSVHLNPAAATHRFVCSTKSLHIAGRYRKITWYVRYAPQIHLLF